MDTLIISKDELRAVIEGLFADNEVIADDEAV